MTKIVQHVEASHYYWPDGTPCYEVEMKSKPGEYRPATLADARKLGLIPSVTTKLQLLDNPYIDSWRVEQAIIAAITLPSIPGESMDDRARRIAEDASSQVGDAMKLGTLIHTVAENYILRREECKDPTISHLFEPFRQWWDSECSELIYSEKSVVHHAEGYAGRVDCKAKLKSYGLAILDFKTRKPSAKGKFSVYDKDILQLAAYREADALTLPKADTCLSVLINSGESGIHIHQWTDEEIAHGWECFHLVSKLWHKMKKF